MKRTNFFSLPIGWWLVGFLGVRLSIYAGLALLPIKDMGITLTAKDCNRMTVEYDSVHLILWGKAITETLVLKSDEISQEYVLHVPPTSSRAVLYGCGQEGQLEFNVQDWTKVEQVWQAWRNLAGWLSWVMVVMIFSNGLKLSKGQTIGFAVGLLGLVGWYNFWGTWQRWFELPKVDLSNGIGASHFFGHSMTADSWWYIGGLGWILAISLIAWWLMRRGGTYD